MQECFFKKNKIIFNIFFFKEVADKVNEWGVKIEQIFIKDMILSNDL